MIIILHVTVKFHYHKTKENIFSQHASRRAHNRFLKIEDTEQSVLSLLFSVFIRRTKSRNIMKMIGNTVTTVQCYS